ncbi:MAG: MFS transporter [Planctomycetes bacterium]|nr:MFS transporter [Planctomycetota bacterium]
MTPFRRLLVICFTSAGWAFSFGVGTQAVTHWLNAHGASNFVIGLNHSTYYLGIALASLLVPGLTRRFGAGCAPTGMMLAGLSLVLFPWSTGAPWWFGLRFLAGVAGALSLIPLEAQVSRESDPAQRTRNFSFYAVALTLGGAAGICAGLHFYEINPTLAFSLGGCAPILSAAVLVRALKQSNPATAFKPRGAVAWSDNFLSYGTAWCQGFLEGGLVAFLSLYLVSLGMSKDAAGLQMGVTLVGVIAFQVPVAWLADRVGRTPMLLTCYAMVAIGLAALPWLQLSWALAVCLFFLGAWSGAMYPLGLALLGDRLPEASLARAYAWYMAMECVGSQLGAAAMGEARDRWGQESMFWVGFAAVLGVVAAWVVVLGVQRWRTWRSPACKVESERQAA